MSVTVDVYSEKAIVVRGTQEHHGPILLEMGGMFTVLKVREQIENYDKDPGWFEKPPGSRATNASEDELKRDLGFVPA